MMKKDIKISRILLIIIGLIIVSLLNCNKVLAADYYFVDTSLFVIGPNSCMIEMEESGTIELQFCNSENEAQNINIDDVTIKCSDDSIIDVNSTQTDENTIEISSSAKSEGCASVTVAYTNPSDGEEYTYEKSYYVYNRDDEFSTGEYAIISKSKAELNSNEQIEVYAETMAAGTYGLSFPDGYDRSTYYNYLWSSSDEDIVTIDNNTSNTVTLTAGSAGKAEVYCTISTADEEETVTKTIEVTVSGNHTTTKLSTTLDFSTGIKGDLDGDGQISIYDAYIVLVKSVELLVEEEDTASENLSEEIGDNWDLIDIDGDEKITSQDALCILTYYAYLAVRNEKTWDEVVDMTCSGTYFKNDQ